MSKAYIFIGLISLYIIPYLELNPFEISKVQVFKDGNTTYSIISEQELPKFVSSQKIISINAKTISTSKIGELQWGKNTEAIQARVLELREESSMFNQILTHLEQSEYPYSINNTVLESAYGAYSSKNGAVSFEVPKMQDFFFDATIIEEFVHAYQALYYNYTHGKFRAERQRKALKQGKDYSIARKAGLTNWKKFGRKQAFIESEAKLITYFVQHQTCSITIEDIIETDNYNTGGKGRKVLDKYLNRHKCFRSNSNKKIGHLSCYFVDLPTFCLYQQRFIKHWRYKAPKSSYTLGYFSHRPDALNNIYKSIACSLPNRQLHQKQAIANKISH
jgi:hypothetical protein